MRHAQSKVLESQKKMNRQVLRPRLEDLEDPPSEDELRSNIHSDVDRNRLSDSSSHPYEDEDEPVYAPAATPMRGAPPQIGTAKKTTDRKVSQRAPQSQSAARDANRVRFDVEGDENASATLKPGQPSSVKIGASGGQGALIGSIQERSGIAGNKLRTPTVPERQGQSRFAALRKLDKDAGIDTTKRGTAATSHASAPRASDLPANDEEWLDEDGQPMSAFRKSRLLKQGLRPPNIRRRDNNIASAGNSQTVSLASTKKDDSAQPMNALMKSISDENDAQIAAMKPEQIASDLEDVREALGDRFLELLRARSKQKEVSPLAQQKDGSPMQISEANQPSTAPKKHTLQPRASSSKTQTPQEIRQRYFRDEPSELPSSLRWMAEESESTSSESLRFDFDGNVVDRETSSETLTRSTGLHHHGDEQDAPGYSANELLHLARSTTPGQRVIALQTIARVVQNYPEQDGKRSEDATSKSVANQVATSRLRGKACTIASWYLQERHLNVRAAALQCVLASLSSCATYAKTSRLIERRPPRPEHDKDAEAGDVAGPSIDTQAFVDDLLPALMASTMLADLTTNDLEILLEIFCLVCQKSRKSCTELITDTRLLPHLMQASIKSRQWPTEELGRAPLPGMLELLTTLIASSRNNALVLYRQKHFQALPRLLSVVPTAASSQVNERASALLTQALKVYSSLALYGIGADEYGKLFSLFTDLVAAIHGCDFEDSTQSSPSLSAISAALSLFANWTLCAQDPHLTLTPHDITWSQVSEFGDLAHGVIDKVAQQISREGNFLDLVAVCAQATRLLDVWIRGGAQKGEVSPQAIMTSFEQNKTLEKIGDALASQSLKIGAVRAETDLDRIVEGCELSLAILSLTGTNFSRHDSAISPDVKQQLAAVAQRARLAIKGLHDTGSCTDETYDRISRHVAELEFQCLTGAEHSAATRFRCVELLTDLQRGDENLARTLIDVELPRRGAPSRMLKILSPFLHENIYHSKSVKPAPIYPSSDAIKSADTLFLVCEEPAATQISGDEEVGSDDNIDPMTGNVLWKSPISGLPLRRDWTLCAFDDLLHSGNCAALNRPNALPQDWDASEAQIVEASLELTVWVCQALNADTGDSARPTSAELHMGITKCLLLEEEQANNTRATGLITGRDLFRRPEIAQLIRQMYTIAQQQATSPQPFSDDLEKVTLRHYGPTRPFYQTYTDLVSVYDAVSFGDELFGRALLLPLTMHYAADYRRCLWIEHAHCLPTIVTAVSDAPSPVSDYLGSEVEKDEGLLGAYVSAVMSGAIRKDRNELLYSIAARNVSRMIWSGTSTSDGDESIHWKNVVKRTARVIFTDRPSIAVPAHARTLRDDIMTSPEAGAALDPDAFLDSLMA